jgi:hypothetical protein
MDFYAKIENNTIVKVQYRPMWFQDNGEPVTDIQLNEQGWFMVEDNPPTYNHNTQKLITEPLLNWIIYPDRVEKTYQVINKTQEEIETEFNQAAQEKDEVINAAILKELLRQQIASVPDEEIDTYSSLFPVFKVGESLIAGDRRQYDDFVWEVLQPHTTQLDWLPPDVPALWKKVYDPATIQLWVQPTMAEDAYSFEDKVYWPDENTTWISNVAGTNTNTWEPGVYGWDVFTG